MEKRNQTLGVLPSSGSETLTSELVVSDVPAAGSGASLGSPPSTVAITVTYVNRPPVALASAPEGSVVGLTGATSDPDGNAVTCVWTQAIGPAIFLSDATAACPNVTAPAADRFGATGVFAMCATDEFNAASTPATASVVIHNVNHAPIANAGGVTIAYETAAVPLTGSFSSDPDGDALTYQWVQTEGPAVGLANPNTATPSFTAPFVTAEGATLKFKLTVRDSFGGSSCDVATVTVRNANDPPTITGVSPSIGTLWTPNHSMVPVSIAGVADSNGNATITIGVTQDDPTEGLGGGDTAIDAIINGDGTLLLRSERGEGRVTVAFIAFTSPRPTSKAAIRGW